MRVQIFQCYPDRNEIQNVTIAFAVEYLLNYKVFGKEDTILDLLLEGFEFSTPNAEYVKLIKN
jgi:hypothetical protein